MSGSNGTQEYDFLFKILLIGDYGVGKSSLVARYTDGTFNEYYISTIGVDFKIKTINVDGFAVKLQIWDPSSSERFRPITRSYYRGAHGIVVLYDISDKESFGKLSFWLGEIEKYAPEDVCKVVVGTKCDLEDRREVTREEGEEFATKAGLSFFEVSSKTGENVDELFTCLAKEIIKKRLESLPIDGKSQNIPVPNDNDGDKKKEGCLIQ